MMPQAQHKDSSYACVGLIIALLFKAIWKDNFHEVAGVLSIIFILMLFNVGVLEDMK